MQRFLTSAAIIIGIAAPAQAQAAPHERSCDGMPATHHVHRARVLLIEAYSIDRWGDPTPAKDREIRAAQEHKRCVRDAKLRTSIEELRESVSREFREYRAYRLVTPYDGPNGTHWAIPYYIVACESYGGSWSASNGSHVGPYQLAWNWGPPWPVTTFAHQLEHHRIARMLWTNYGSGQWACA